eukprot:gene6297-7019_t
MANSQDQEAATTASTTTKVKIPFGEAAIWALGVDEVEDCAAGKCEDETKAGVLQALKYALNNARLALGHGERDAKLADKYLKTFDKMLYQVSKLENMDQEGKKYKKKFRKTIQDFLKVFAEKKLAKKLSKLTIEMEMPDNDIGVEWMSKSAEIPVYTAEDTKKGLAELKFKMNNGVEIPRVGFGTWQMEGQECIDAVITALKIGYRHIDTAQSYENEGAVGNAIQEAIKQGIIKSREDVFIATKLSDPSDFGKNKTQKRFAKQLELLQTEYVDVYMLHGPDTEKKNKAAWKDMIEMLKQGKIKALGISNFESVDDVKALARNMAYKPNYIQNKFSIYSPGGQSVEQDSMLQKMEARGMAYVAYSINNPWPFVLPPRNDPHVLAIAARYNRTAAQVLNRWALQMNALIIPKSSNAARVEENAAVLQFALKEIDMRLLNGLATLYQSTTEQRPVFVKDVFGLFNEETEETEQVEEVEENTPRDEL